MSPNFIDHPQRSPELRAEVERLLETDDSRAGEVFRSSLEATQDRRGTETKATNEVHYILPALLEGRIPSAVEPQKMVAARLRSWLRAQPLSPALREDLEAQLRALDSLSPTAATVRRFKLPENTDRDVLAKARAEQDKLRNYLLNGRDEAPCDLCGRVLPAELVVAAHIVPRHRLDHDQRLDFDRIAMIACQLGCDRLFERGYLTVDDKGIVEARTVDGDLLSSLEDAAGRRCTAHNGLTAGAFAAHRADWRTELEPAGGPHQEWEKTDV